MFLDNPETYLEDVESLRDNYEDGEYMHDLATQLLGLRTYPTDEARRIIERKLADEYARFPITMLVRAWMYAGIW